MLYWGFESLRARVETNKENLTLEEAIAELSSLMDEVYDERDIGKVRITLDRFGEEKQIVVYKVDGTWLIDPEPSAE